MSLNANLRETEEEGGVSFVLMLLYVESSCGQNEEIYEEKVEK